MPDGKEKKVPPVEGSRGVEHAYESERCASGIGVMDGIHALGACGGSSILPSPTIFVLLTEAGGCAKF
jgi:hypothetical protein